VLSLDAFFLPSGGRWYAGLDGIAAMAESKPKRCSRDSIIRLSTPLVPYFQVGVPVVLAATLIGCGAVYFSANDIGANSLWFIVAGAVFVYWGWKCARLVSVHVVGDQLRFSTFFGVNVFPVSDLMELTVKYRRGIPWAVFRVSRRGDSHVANFHTVLRPKLEYLWTKALPDLSILDGVLIRYKGLWGQERVEIIGEKVTENKCQAGKHQPPTN
jgi:hypothetical protein